MESLSGVRVLPGRHGTWYTGNGRSILATEQVQPLTPPDEVRRAIEDNGLLDTHERRYGATVMLTTRCNLTCSYCFQNESFDDSGLARIDRKDLTAQTATLARDFVSEQMHKYGKSELQLLLTGGEPLIKFRRCLEVLDAMAALNLTQASMFTNGVLLTQARAVALAQSGLTHIQVSFDGAATLHDEYRKTTAGMGSYGRIMENLASAIDAAASLKVTARLNVNARNLTSLDDLLRTLSQFDAASRLSIRFGLVDDIGLNFSDAPERSEETAKRIRELALHALDLGLHVQPMAAPGDCLFCGVVGGASGCVINADGTLYSCWESVGRTGFEVGDLTHGYMPMHDLADRWVDCSYNVTDAQASKTAARRISDIVDAAVLDHAYELRYPGSAA